MRGGKLYSLSPSLPLLSAGELARVDATSCDLANVGAADGERAVGGIVSTQFLVRAVAAKYAATAAGEEVYSVIPADCLHCVGGAGCRRRGIVCYLLDLYRAAGVKAVDYLTTSEFRRRRSTR